jgi:hypothetical protein
LRMDAGRIVLPVNPEGSKDGSLICLHDFVMYADLSSSHSKSCPEYSGVRQPSRYVRIPPMAWECLFWFLNAIIGCFTGQLWGWWARISFKGTNEWITDRKKRTFKGTIRPLLCNILLFCQARVLFTHWTLNNKYSWVKNTLNSHLDIRPINPNHGEWSESIKHKTLFHQNPTPRTHLHLIQTNGICSSTRHKVTFWIETRNVRTFWMAKN